MTLQKRAARALLIIAMGFCLAYLLPDACVITHQLIPIRRLRSAIEGIQQELATWQGNLILLGIGCGLGSLSPPKKKGEKHEAKDWLDRTLLTWPSGDAWSVRHALESVLVMGGTGSGKSSTSGREIAIAMLADGWGGIFLTAKPGDRQTYEGYCRAAGRSGDVVVIDERAKERFNPLLQEAEVGCPGGVTENVLHLLTTILEVSDSGSGQSSGREEDGYWKKTSAQLMRNAIDLMLLAEEPLTMAGIYNVIISAPLSKSHLESTAWREASFCIQLLTRADERELTDSQGSDFRLVADYFLTEWPELSEKTRSIVLSTFTSSVDVLNRGLLRDLLCADSTVSPRACEDGKILIIDLPIKRYGVVGRMAQVVWKYAWQKSIERRNVAESPRPVFLFADECQTVVSANDAAFLATARSSRAATVYLTQNIGGLEAALGGERKGEASVKSLIGNLSTKVLHGNADSTTNSWAAELVGKSLLTTANSGFSRPDQMSVGTLMGFENPGQVNVGTNQSMDYRIQPADFSTFLTGGPDNAGVVEALIHQSGRTFRSTGLPFTFVRFQQAPL